MAPTTRNMLAVLLTISFATKTFGEPRLDPLVNTNVGLIRGMRATDGDYTMFMGIPYGHVNASNPFGKAIPQEPFNDIFEALDDTAICPQIEEFNKTFAGILDCLHLNVYVPTKANMNNPKAVLVWIYGGGFEIGFSGRYLYGPKFFVRHDIILVTLNYRLGAYGFMCLDTPEIPGNQGLKDQLLGLRWIKDNIAGFGGDPNKVTVVGESAGAISADFHLLSPHEKLFDKMIIQSGTSLSPVYKVPNSKQSIILLARHLGFDVENINDALELLISVEPKSVIVATKELGLSFRVCVEKKFDGVENIIVEDWLRAEMPKAKRMPILIGFNEDEAILYYLNKPNRTESIDIIQKKLSLRFDVKNPDFQGMGDIIRQYYLGNEDNFMDVINFDSDFTYIYPTHKSIERYLNNDAGNIFLYVFSYVGDRNFVRRNLNITFGGAVRADEVGYMFDISFYEETPSVEDQLTIDQITTMWANFVKFGNPTPTKSDLLPVEWQPIKKDSAFYYMDLGSELKVKSRPFHGRMSFWDLFYRANDNLLRLHGEGN